MAFTYQGTSGGILVVKAEDVDSEAATDGFVLTADGAGGAAFEVIPTPDPEWEYVFKTAAESVTSNTVVQDDDHIVMTLTEGKWLVELQLEMTSGVVAGTIKWGWSSVAGTSGLRRYTSGASLASQGVYTTAVPGSLSIEREWMVLNVPAGGGTYRLQWAQNSSNATPTTLGTATYVRYKKVP